MENNKKYQDKNAGEPLAFNFADGMRQVARLRVVGVGGAGGNAVNRMIENQLNGVDFVTLNTDLQALEQNLAPSRIQIGKNLTKGLGAGGNPEIGRKAVEESKDAVIENLSDADMVFITCGMGGGTGTGAAPIVAEIARDLNALTVGIVTKPFTFEGAKRSEKAEMGIKELKQHVDTLIVVPNQKLISLVPKDTPLEVAFRMADEILLHATKGISDVINVPGLVNLDFADVKTVMSQMGDALMGSGMGTGETRAKDAAEKAISSPMIEDVSITGALGVLVNITGGKELSLNDINEATTVIYEAAGSGANIIFGAVIDPSMNGDLRVTVIATGFHKNGFNGSFYDERVKKISNHTLSESTKYMPMFQKMETETLEKTLSDIFGNDGGIPLISKDELDVPTFIRRRME